MAADSAGTAASAAATSTAAADPARQQYPPSWDVGTAEHSRHAHHDPRHRRRCCDIKGQVEDCCASLLACVETNGDCRELVRRYMSVQAVFNSVDYHELWRHFGKGKDFRFDITFAENGGFSKAGKLFDWTRYGFAAVSIVMLVANIHTVVNRNLRVIFTMDWQAQKGVEPPLLISNLILRMFFIRPLQENVLIGLFEITLLTLYTARASLLIIRGLCTCSPCNRWHCIVLFFWEVLPRLRSFSAMWVLHFVTPSVLVPELTEAVAKFRDEKEQRQGLPKTRLALFLILRLLAGMVGFDAFLVKLRATTKQRPPTERWSAFKEVVAYLVFLNQMLGVVQVSMFVQQRLFVFVFGGQKGELTPQDEAVMRTWQALIARRMWQDNSVVQYVCLMLTFSDYDFQALVIEEPEKVQMRTTTEVPYFLAPRPRKGREGDDIEFAQFDQFDRRSLFSNFPNFPGESRRHSLPPTFGTPV